jgi:glucan phosphoethanolaminetransferase (alkaline phosphatase superfamily)
MNKINFGRVILGGLLAGLLLNIGEFLLNAVVLADQMKAFNAQHNFAEPGTSFMIMAVVLTFVLGIVMVLGYASIRPRFGPGVKTALIASLFAWFGLYFYMGLFFAVLFGISTGTCVMTMVWGLVEYAIATVAGAWLYKEP